MYQTLFSFKKILFSFSLLSLFLNTLWADDFLAKLTNNALSDTSQGVKKLNLKEASEVVGGYVLADYHFTRQSVKLESELVFIFSATSAEIEKGGLCEVGKATCNNVSQRRLVDWLHAINWTGQFHPAYIVNRKIKISDKGARYVLFSYGVGAVNSKTKQLFKFDSKTTSVLLNNNMVIKEIANKYKGSMEDILGGYNPRIY